jgi:hypothetical protein
MNDQTKHDPNDQDCNCDACIKRWLQIRKDEAPLIDPATAEVEWSYGQVIDPYGVLREIPDEAYCVGREYFARRPGGKVWVNFCDLSKETRDALWSRHSRKLAFPSGLPGFDHDEAPF